MMGFRQALAAELKDYMLADGKIVPVQICFGNVKHEVAETFKAARLVEHMYAQTHTREATSSS